MKQLLLVLAALLTSVCMNAQPSVDYTVDEVGTDFITITFSPNSEAAGYAICLFEAGTAEQQFAMFGTWMGFSTMGDMVKAWGFNATVEQQMSWTGDTPGKDYEVYVQCWDVNGAYADMIIIPITTAKLGGDGLAEIAIELGEYLPRHAHREECLRDRGLGRRWRHCLSDPGHDQHLRLGPYWC